MFKKLINEAYFNIALIPYGPLIIKSGNTNLLNPSLPDIQFVRTHFQGKETVFIPGSSLKGVFRSRTEQIIRALGGDACLITSRKRSDNSCNNYEKEASKKNAEERYKMSCQACRIFGSTFIKGRVAFSDAYPDDGTVRLGIRTNVAINRITGGAINSALFNPEVVEDGVFRFVIKLVNFELWQLKLITTVLQDLDEGYISLGYGTTRGYGRVKCPEVKVEIRDYRLNIGNKLVGINIDDKGCEAPFSNYGYLRKFETNDYRDLLSETGPLGNIDLAKQINLGRG